MFRTQRTLRQPVAALTWWAIPLVALVGAGMSRAEDPRTSDDDARIEQLRSDFETDWARGQALAQAGDGGSAVVDAADAPVTQPADHTSAGERAKSLRERIEQRRRQSARTAALTATQPAAGVPAPTPPHVPPTTQPVPGPSQAPPAAPGMRLDADQLPDIAPAELEAERRRAIEARWAAAAAARAQAAEQAAEGEEDPAGAATRPAPEPVNVPPPVPVTPGEPQPQPVPQPVEPGVPQPVQPGVPQPVPVLPGVQQPAQPGVPARPPGQPQPPPGLTASPQAVPANLVNPATGLPDTKQQPGWWKLPPEERPYFFAWKDVPLEKACQDIAEMSGLTLMGLTGTDASLKNQPISFQSVKIMTFDEALATFNSILAEPSLNLWMIRRDGYLQVRAMTDWYRHIPPERMYKSLEAYRAAALPPWEIASLVYAPKEAMPEMLAARAMDTIPDNTVRLTVIPDTNLIEIKGFVQYIERALDFVISNDVPADDGRVLQVYELKYAAPEDATELLNNLLPRSSGVPVMTTPRPVPQPRPRPGQPPQPVPQPVPEMTMAGPGTSDQVEIQQDTRQNRLMIKATPARHRLVKEYLEKYIDVPLIEGMKTEVITLKYTDPNEVVELIRPMLGRVEIYQPPPPPQRQPRPGEPQQPQQPQPMPPPVTITKGSTAVMTPLTSSPSFLVKANADEMAKIKQLVEMLDVPSEESKFKLVRLNHASAATVAETLNEILGSRTSRFRAQAGLPQTTFRAVADTTDDRAIVLTGTRQDLEDADKLIKELDIDTEAGASTRLVRLKNSTPSTLAEMLRTRFSRSGGGGGGYGRRGYYYYDSSSGGGLPQFIPDDESKALLVTCRDAMWEDIERLIREIDEGSEVAKTSKVYRLKHSEPSSVVSILQEATSGGGRRWGDPSAPQFGYDYNGDALVVTANESDHRRIAELIAELDSPGPAGEAEFRAIELKHADAEYVAEKVQELLGGGSGGYGGYRGRRFYYGGGDDSGNVVVAERVSNRVLIKCTAEDFKRAEELAARIDRDYEAKTSIRKTFVLTHAQPWEVREILETVFEQRTGRSVGYRSYYGGGGSSAGPEGITISEISGGLIVQAPKDKMAEIEAFIAELDTERGAGVEMRTYRVKGTDYRGTSEIARSLQELYEAGRGQAPSAGGYGRGAARSDVRFIGQPGSDLLFVTAPASKMEEVDRQVKQVLEARQAVDLTMTIRHFEVRQARPADVADLIEPILEAKYRELAEQSGGGGYSRWGNEPRVTAHRASGRLMVMAPEPLMAVAEELIREFDQPPAPSTTRIVALTKAKAEEIAPIVEEQVRSRAGSSGGRSRRFSRWSSFWDTSGGAAEADEVSVTAVESSNSVIIRGPEEKVHEAEQLVRTLDGSARPEGMFKVYRLQYADLYEVSGMIEDIVGGGRSSSLGSTSGSRGGGGGGSLRVKTDYQTNQIIVAAPAEKFPVIEQIVGQMEEIAREKKSDPATAGTGGTVIGQTKYGTTKLYDVKQPAKEVAEYLDKALYALLGWDAPYVKSFPYTNQIIVTGDPKQFGLVEDMLKKYEQNPPPVKTTVRVYRVSDPAKVVSQFQRFASPSLAQQINVRPIPRLGGKADPMALLQQREVGMYVTEAATTAPAPYVPDGELRRLHAAVSALAGLQVAEAAPSTQPAAGGSAEQPSAATRPAEPVSAGGNPDEATATQPAAIPETPLSPQAPAPSAEPAAVPGSESPTAAAPVSESPTAAPPPGGLAPVGSAAPAAATPAEGRSPSPAPDGQPPVSREEFTYNQLLEAAGEARLSDVAQIRYDEEGGYIFIIGRESQLDEIKELMDLTIKEMEKIEETARTEFKVVRVEHIDVNVAAAILEQMFNDQQPPRPGPQTAQAARQRARQQAQAKQGQKKPGEEEGEEGAAARRREEEEQQQAEQEAAAQAAVGQRIKVMPDPRTRTLIIRAAPEMFPAIAELLLKIDRPSDRPPVDIRIFQLQKLNAYEVEQAIKAILKIRDPNALRGQFAAGRMRGLGGTFDQQSMMIEQLQQQMLELQMADLMQAQAQAAEGQVQPGQEGQTPGAQAGKLALNPAKDITITSDATTNSIIVSAPEEGMQLVKKLIDQLEGVEIPLQIRTFNVKYGDAEKLAGELEKIFQGGGARRGRGGEGGGEGITPSRVGGDIRISADARTNTIIVRALEPDMAKVEPILKELDVPLGDQRVQLYPVEHGSATAMAETLTGIFSKEEDAKGARAVSIKGDADTNSLLVWAPEDKQMIIAAKIRELDQRVGATVVPRRLQLSGVASATDIAEKLTEIFAPKGAGRKGPRQVTITGDDNSATLFVTAPDELFRQIQEVAQMLDTPSKQDIRVFRLKHATAADVYAQFKDLMGQALIQLRGKGGAQDVFAATPDARTNALIVTGTPAVFLAVEKVLADLDVPPSDTTEVTVAMFGLTNGSAASVAATINGLYAGQTFPGGVKPPHAVAEPISNCVYVYGTKQQIQQIKASVIDPLQTQLGPLAAAIKEYTIPVKHARVEEVAAQIQQWFASRTANLKAAGYASLAPAETAVSVLADPATRQLFVSCSESNKAKIDELMAMFDTPEVAGTDLQIRVRPLKFAVPEYVATVIRSQFAPTGKVPERDRVTVDVEYSSNSLVIKASPENHEKVEALIAQIDTGEATRMAAPERVQVQNVRASDLAATLTTMITRTMKPDRRTGAYPVTVTADDTSNSLLLTGMPAQVEDIRNLIPQLDSRPAEDPREVRPYVLQYADLVSTQNMLAARFKGQEKLALKDQVTTAVDYTLGAVVVTASPEKHAEVARIIQELDNAEIARIRVPQTIPVQNVRASDLAATLTAMIRQTKRLDKRTGQYPVTVTADDVANTLLVTAGEQDLAEMRQLIAQLDTRPADDPREVRPYVLQFADMASTMNIISAKFKNQEKRNVRDQVLVTPDYATNALVVTASPENHAEVARIIQDLDNASLAQVQAPETIRVQHVLASQLAATLTDMIRASKRIDKRTGRYPVTVTANDATNTLLVTASPRELEEVRKLIAQLDVPLAEGDDRPIRPYFLEFADITAVKAAIDQRFAANKGLSPREQVTVVPEYGTNSLVVTASEENHAIVAEIVKGLDQTSLGARQTFPIEIKYAEPEDLAAALTAIYNNAMPRTRTNRVPAVFTVAQGSRKLLVTCTPAELDDVQKLIAELDVEESGRQQEMRVVALRSIAPAEMSQILTQYLAKPGRAGRYDPSLVGNVKVLPSQSASAVVLTGPKERLDELENLVRQVDDAAPKADDPQTGRQIMVMPLTNADPYSVAAVITRSFARRGTTAEADMVDATAERATNSLVVTASRENLEKIRKMVEDLDRNSANTPQQVIIPMQHARAEELAEVLTQTYRTSRAATGGPPVGFAADPNSNALVVSAGQADLEGIRELVGQLDRPATESIEEIRIIPLEFLDAAETLEVLQEFLRKPGSTRGYRGAGGELIGGLKLQASQAMNTLIASGSRAELDRLQEMVKAMDRENVGAGTAPRIIRLEHAVAAQLATTLSKLFTDPARTRRGGRSGGQEDVPLIMADEGSNSLLVRARTVDYNLIEDMVRRLDQESTGPAGMEVIPVSRGVDVQRLAQEIERTVNAGERFKAQQQQGYRPGQVAIGVEERVPALLVAGSPELFPVVRKLVTTLQELKPAGSGQRAMVIPVRNMPSQDVKRILDQFIEKQTGTKTRR